MIKATKHRGWHTQVVDITYPVSDGVEGLVPALDRIADECCQAAKDGYQLLVLSDRNAGSKRYCWFIDVYSYWSMNKIVYI